MAKKLLAIVLSLVFVFAFGFVVSAQEAAVSPNCTYVCGCGEEPCDHECDIICSPCLCPPDATCVEDCECATGGPCVCPQPEEGGAFRAFLRGLGWGTLGAWVAMVATVVIAFFIVG